MQATATLQSWDMWPSSFNNMSSSSGGGGSNLPPANAPAAAPSSSISISAAAASMSTSASNLLSSSITGGILGSSFGSAAGSFGSFGFGMMSDVVAPSALHHVSASCFSTGTGPSALDTQADSLLSMSLSMFEEDLFFGLPMDSAAGSGGCGSAGSTILAAASSSGASAGATTAAAAAAASALTTPHAAALAAGAAAAGTMVSGNGSAMQHHFGLQNAHQRRSQTMQLGTFCEMMDEDEEEDADLDLDLLHSALAEELLFDMDEDLDPVMQEVMQASDLSSLMDQFERTEKTISMLTSKDSEAEVVELDEYADVEIPFQEVPHLSLGHTTTTATAHTGSGCKKASLSGSRMQEGDKKTHSLLAKKQGSLMSPKSNGSGSGRNGWPAGSKEKRRKKKKGNSGGMSLLAPPSSSSNANLSVHKAKASGAPTAAPAAATVVSIAGSVVRPATVVLRPMHSSQNVMLPLQQHHQVNSSTGGRSSHALITIIPASTALCSAAGAAAAAPRLTRVPIADHDYCPSSSSSNSSSSASSGKRTETSSCPRPSDARLIG